jgi:hypothetical protein
MLTACFEKPLSPANCLEKRIGQPYQTSAAREKKYPRVD